MSTLSRQILELSTAIKGSAGWAGRIGGKIAALLRRPLVGLFLVAMLLPFALPPLNPLVQAADSDTGFLQQWSP